MTAYGMRLSHHIPALDKKGEVSPDCTNSKPTLSEVFLSVMVYLLNVLKSSLIVPLSGKQNFHHVNLWRTFHITISNMIFKRLSLHV